MVFIYSLTTIAYIALIVFFGKIFMSTPSFILPLLGLPNRVVITEDNVDRWESFRSQQDWLIAWRRFVTPLMVCAVLGTCIIISDETLNSTPLFTMILLAILVTFGSMLIKRAFYENVFSISMIITFVTFSDKFRGTRKDGLHTNGKVILLGLSYYAVALVVFYFGVF